MSLKEACKTLTAAPSPAISSELIRLSAGAAGLPPFCRSHCWTSRRGRQAPVADGGENCGIAQRQLCGTRSQRVLPPEPDCREFPPKQTLAKKANGNPTLSVRTIITYADGHPLCVINESSSYRASAGSANLESTDRWVR